MNKKYNQQKFNELTQTYFNELEKIGIKICFVSAIEIGKAKAHQALGFVDELDQGLTKRSLKVTQKALIKMVKSAIANRINTIEQEKKLGRR